MHHLSLLLLLVVLGLFILFPWWIALPVSLPMLGFLALSYFKGHQAQHQPPTTGEEAMIGDQAVVVDGQEGTLEVLYEGERWRAVSAQHVWPGERVVIRGVKGLTLVVSPLSTPAAGPATRKRGRPPEMTPTTTH